MLSIVLRVATLAKALVGDSSANRWTAVTGMLPLVEESGVQMMENDDSVPESAILPSRAKHIKSEPHAKFMLPMFSWRQ